MRIIKMENIEKFYNCNYISKLLINKIHKNHHNKIKIQRVKAWQQATRETELSGQQMTGIFEKTCAIEAVGGIIILRSSSLFTLHLFCMRFSRIQNVFLWKNFSDLLTLRSRLSYSAYPQSTAWVLHKKVIHNVGTKGK